MLADEDIPEGYTREQWAGMLRCVAALEDEVPAMPEPWPDGDVVYFITCAGTNAIKIGISENLRARVRQLYTILPYGISEVWYCPGGLRLEQSLHAELWEHRLCGEWFAPKAEVTERRIGLGCLPVPHDAVRQFRWMPEKEKAI